MEKNEIKKLSRSELLEMLIEQGKENDRLKDLLLEAQGRAESRELKIRNAGSMAEAAMVLNDVFAAADAAAAQYLETLRKSSEERQADSDKLISDAQKKADAIVAAANKKAAKTTAEAEAVLADAKQQAEKIIAEAEEHWIELLKRPDTLNVDQS